MSVSSLQSRTETAIRLARQSITWSASRHGKHLLVIYMLFRWLCGGAREHKQHKFDSEFVSLPLLTKHNVAIFYVLTKSHSESTKCTHINIVINGEQLQYNGASPCQPGIGDDATAATTTAAAASTTATGCGPVE